MEGCSRVYLLTAALLLITADSGVNAANILLYPFGHCLNSHLINFAKLGQILEEEHHEVTFLISDRYATFRHRMNFNNNDIIAANSIQFQAPQNHKPVCEFDTIDFMLYSPISERFNRLIDTFIQYCDSILSDRKLMAQLKEANYDLFILEALDPCSRILADYLDVPFMPLMTTGLGHADGNPRPPSYVPAAISPFSPIMTFWERIGNLIMKVMYDTIPVIMGFDSSFEKLKEKHQLNTSLSLTATFNRAALKLVNSDFVLEYPAPIEPDTILIGGFSIAQPAPLTGALKSIVDNAKDGVILFSFGTLVHHFDGIWMKMFVDDLAQLSEVVLWKNGAALDNQTQLTDNIHIMQWMPQVDLLAHPNVKLIITHCGLNTALEAAYFGVPVIALPISGDQFNNAAKLTNHVKMGVQLDIHSLTSGQLLEAVHTVLHDDQYTKNAKAVSQRFKDQPISKRDVIHHWINYVLRHKGAEHLKSAAHHLTWIQYNSLDVLAVLLCVVSLLSFSVIKFIQLLTLRGLAYMRSSFGKMRIVEQGRYLTSQGFAYVQNRLQQTKTKLQ